MKNIFYIIFLIAISLPLNVNANLKKDIDDYKKELHKNGYNDGDPNQTEILESSENYIVIRNMTAKTSISARLVDDIVTQPALIFQEEARRHCEKNSLLIRYTQDESLHLDMHTAYYICTYSFNDEVKKYYKLTDSKKDRNDLFYLDVCYNQKDSDIIQEECEKRSVRKILKKYPYAENIYNKINKHEWKYKGNSFVFDLKKRIFAKNNKPSISTEDGSKVVAASSGTGFFVSNNGHIVTNNHVIESCNEVKVHFKGREVTSEVLYTDKGNDLAIIKTNLKPNQVFAVSNEDVSLLEDIIVAGYPLGKAISASIKTSKGSVTSLAGYGDNYSNFQIDASLNSGNSGGPIMDNKGNIVGVAVAKYVEEGVEGFNFGVKSSTLKTFASSNQFKFQDPLTEELSNKELGQLITEATIYLECWMSIAKIKQIIEEGERQKAFFSEYK